MVEPLTDKSTGWGYYLRGSDQQIEVDELGTRLSIAIGCPVHYPAFNKSLFECKCGCVFPLYVVKGQTDAQLRDLHDNR